MDAARKKTFMLGVGCQKGGTSWLHEYLCKNPSVNMGKVKEYHVYDILFAPVKKRSVLDMIKLQSVNNNIEIRLKFIKDMDKYFEYFDSLCTGDVDFTGDITPSYSGLPSYAFKYVKDRLTEYGFNIKVVFLMRDPFERIWSSIRMDLRNKKKKVNSIEQIELLLRLYDKRDSIFRTQYDKTIKNLEMVFDENEIYYDFYEDFFSETGIQRLSDFLGIEYIKPDLDKYVNATQKQEIENIEIMKTIISNYYRETYFYIFDKFGEEKIRELWDSARFLI